MRGVGIRAFRAEDAARIELRPDQYVECGIEFDAGYGRVLEDAGRGWTALSSDGRILACFGLADEYGGRQAMGWALMASDIGVARHLAITRFARAIIAGSAHRRVNVMVRDDAAGRGPKWARALGLRFRCALDAWGGASERVLLFDRVRP